jgi:sec-independent protein translocase protein TatB
MEIFNIGPLELILIVVLALVVFGPDGMVKYSREAARFIGKIIRSPLWKDLVSTSEEIKTIPRQLVKEANLEDSLKEISHLSNTIVEPVKADLLGEMQREIENKPEKPPESNPPTEPD